ncbi:protein of unknown function [Marivirga sericea]|uniref:DUF4932 domain-containing protein n=1 Tax=Marivirga sericea TaxID=1028 RepID=A0A1X7L289_9BACT|nr:DUF4932 domain-containing protein [Marivirga sericea]SMG47978.1 protein of unknown function [Marivirga sericea]
MLNKKIIILLFLIAIVSLFLVTNRNKIVRHFYPRVAIAEKHINNISVETPKTYELLQIACSLTPTFQNDPNLLNKKSEYYSDVEKYFGSFSNHPLIQKLENHLDFKSNLAIRLHSISYDVNNSNELEQNNTIRFNPIVKKIFYWNSFLISENQKLINDFAKQTDFASFYEKHEHYYQDLAENYQKRCDFEGMKLWLETKFDNEHQSYRVVFSPLTGGLHFTLALKNNQEMSQTFMFVSSNLRPIDTLDIDKAEISNGLQSRVVFTEIDHNYVNPLTDQFISELEKSMKNYKDWNIQSKSNYKSKYKTFNEYMTWGVFSLYALDTYTPKNSKKIIERTTRLINDRRKFHRFEDFNNELIRQYKLKGKPKIETLYPIMLKWMREYA